MGDDPPICRLCGERPGRGYPALCSPCHWDLLTECDEDTYYGVLAHLIEEDKLDNPS